MHVRVCAFTTVITGTLVRIKIKSMIVSLCTLFTILFLNFISTGCIGSLGRKAPCLKLIITVLLVVVPASIYTIIMDRIHFLYTMSCRIYLLER